jgi:hypothetical protein
MNKGIVGSTNLPAVIDAYKQAENAVEAWLGEQDFKLKEKASNRQTNHLGGILAGVKAGDNIGLDQQLENGQPTGQRRITNG